MDKSVIAETIKKIKTDSKKRKFTQRIDMIVNLKNLDLKKVENQVDFYVTLTHDLGKKVKVCALVGPELQEESKNMDKAVYVDDFGTFQKDKAAAKKLAEDYDYFVAQANVMPKVAGAFGRILGPRKKMPNPKAGCVVPPKANLKAVYEKLQRTVRISAKTAPLVQCAVGTEDMKEEDVIETIVYIYDQLIHHLPNEQNNIKSVSLKLTMGKPVKVE